MEIITLKKQILSDIKDSKLELFEENADSQKIGGAFRFLPDISDPESLLRSKIFQLIDFSNPKRYVLVSFDLEGRLLNIELGSNTLQGNIKIFERSFDGKFYVYLENCKNLRLEEKEIYRYYDYYNEVISEDLEICKFLIDSVNLLLRKIFDSNFTSTNKIELMMAGSMDDVSSYKKVKTFSVDIIQVLKKAYQLYDWKGLTNDQFFLKKIYPTPVNVLPPEVRPDQNPVFSVVQINQGCWLKDSRGPCKFCNSYQGVRYREKELREIVEHIDWLKKFSGKGWKYVKKIFLSDGDPLHTNINTEVFLNFLSEKIPNAKWYEAFVSTPTILSKTSEKWRKLMSLGLKKLYWGVESADDRILKILGKSHNKKILYKAASILNEVNIPYVVILLSGIGNLNSENDNYGLEENPHIIETAKFVQDINCKNVYISRFVPQPETEIFELIRRKILFFPSMSEREREHRMMVKRISYDADNCLEPKRNIKGTYGVQFSQ